MNRSAKGRLSVARELVLDVPADTVWALVGDFNGLNVWHPAVLSSALLEGSNNQPGAVRQLRLGGEATITERLVKYSGADKSCTYIILSGVMPVLRYESTIQVESTEEGASRISWKGTFDAKDVSDADAVKAIEGVYEGGFSALQQYFSR